MVRVFHKDTYTAGESIAHISDGGRHKSLGSPGVPAGGTPVFIDFFNGLAELGPCSMGISIWVLGESHVGGDRRSIHGGKSWLE